jgi:hypothetical protein
VPHVTIPDVATENIFTVTTSTTGPFTFSFSYFTSSDIRVAFNGVEIASGAFTVTPTVTADYGYEGGSLTLTAAVASGSLRVWRDVPSSRTTDFPTAGPFNVTTLNTWLDKMFAILQQVETSMSRTLRMSDTEGSTLSSLPLKADRLSKALMFDASGNPTAGPTASEISSAQTYATNASASASAASTSASAAATSATAAATSASSAATSASSISSLTAASSIASASTIDIGAVAAEYLTVSGTTTINALGTVAAGLHRVLKFDDILTLTHNATSLILPGGASITTAAGDVAGFRSLGTGNWRCEWYSRANGAPNATVPVANGGTGSTTASTARTALAVAGLADANSFTAAQRGSISALTDGATITPNFALANNFSLTIGGNRTLANPTNLTAGQSGAIVITQDSTGSRTLAYGSNWKFAGGTAPTLTTTASAVDVLVYYVESASRITASLINDVK